MGDKRLIEVDFPLKAVSEESAREKSIRHGHISTLHLWWARRPLASSRATAFSALTSAPGSSRDLRKKLEFISELSKWRNSLNQRLIENSRKEISSFYGGKTAKVLDCFAGGGSIPLEALRLGCETYALELNPVAVLILKAVLEYPQKFGKGRTRASVSFHSATNPLLEDITKWGNWVLAKAKSEIGKFYPQDPDGSIPVGYIWARTIRCQNPSCRAEIPLVRQMWLSRVKDKRVALKFSPKKENGTMSFRIVSDHEIDFDPSIGNIRRSTAFCPVCDSGISSGELKKQFLEGDADQKMLAVVLHQPTKRGKFYRLASKQDLTIFREAEQYLETKRQNLRERWGIDPVPDEPGPPKKTHRAVGSQLPLYGFRNWGDLFNSRQKLALITFAEKIRLAYEKMIEENYDADYIKAIMTYLAFALDRLSAFDSSLVLWVSQGEFLANTFTRQALQMVWDYCELDPFSGASGDWNSALNWILRVVDHCSQTSSQAAKISFGTSTRLPYSDNFFDAVFTDPPYYDNVPYSDLSDFFYVWLKRTVGELYPELFSTPLTPKSEEIIQNAPRQGGYDKAKNFFEEMMIKSFREICRVLKPSGIAVIVFAHKSTDAWEAIINSLLQAGLYLTASWPIHTERKTRLVARGTAALASSVYMVCRKRVGNQTTYFGEIRDKIEERIKRKLFQFWEQGIGGADFFVSAIGPAVEVFGKYSKVEKPSGEEVTAPELLEYVRKIVSEFALKRVLKRADLGGVDAETRFYLLWRWTFGNARVPFDDAIKLSRPMGVELTDMWDRGEIVKKEKEFVRVLDPKERAKDPAFLRKTKFTSMIDVLHHVVILWEQGNKEQIKEIIDNTGYAGNEIFWQTAQAISEVLPQGDKERQLLQGFLYGKEVYIKETVGRKRTLLDFVEE